MKFTYIGNQENKEVKVAGSYANGAYVTANAAYGSQNTTATYANAAFVYANAAFIAANTGGSATDQYARDTANGSFVQANAAYGQANTATNNATTADSKAVTAGTYANSAYTQANTATNNAATADSKAVDAGTYANSAYTQANTATTNASTADSKAVTAGVYANSAYTQANTATNNAVSGSLYANAAFEKANSGVANTAVTATTANVAINARITIVNTGIYFPIVTDTTITGSDTFHYSSNDFLMYAANNTFRATGNLWAGQFITVGSNIPVVNSTGHWVGQTLTAIDETARTTANNALPKAGGVVTGNLMLSSAATMRIQNTATTTSNNTGALIIDGGLAVKGNTWISGVFTVDGDFQVGNQNTSGNVYNTGTVTFIQPTLFTSNAATTSNTTGAIIVTGGIGAKGNVHSGSIRITGSSANNITFDQGTTQIGSSSILAQDITATGNLIVSGAGGDISNANTVFANVVSLTTAAIVAGLNVVPYLQSSFAQANTATSGSTYANAAYTQANTATTNAATADSKAVTAGIYANAAYTQANSVYLPSVTRLNVTNSGASAYLISSYTGNNPTIYVTAGETIAFNLNVTGHPFMIRVSNGGTNYNTGLTHVDTNGTVTTDSAAQGQISGTLYWSVPFDLAGNNYVYQCSVHSGMVGTISIGQPSAILLSTTNSAFIQANAAFAAANTGGADSFARNTANASFIQANAAFAAANAGGAGTDQYARDTANAALAAANSAGTGLLIYNNFFTANGNTSTFNLSTSPETEDFTFVNIDGVLQLKSTYSITGNTVVLTENVPANSNVEITVLGGANLDQYSRNVANAAYAQSNTATNNADGASLYANGSFIQANAAFAAANAGGAGTDQYARDTANAAFIQANTDFTNITITSPGTYGNATYVPVITVTSNGRINTISTIAITGGGGGGADQFARDTSNAAFIQANAAFAQANTGGGGGGTTTSNNGSTLSGSITPLANTSDQFNIIGITGNITIETPAGTPTDGQKLIIRLKDAGTSVNVSWNVIYRAVGVSLPTTTVANKTAYIGFIYNTLDADWDAVAISLET